MDEHVLNGRNSSAGPASLCGRQSSPAPGGRDRTRLRCNRNPIQQMVWLDDLPVGLLVGAGAQQQLDYVEPDQLGTPRVVIDTSKDAAVWSWDVRGEVFGATPPNEDPDGDGVSFVFDMRYPGQRYDAASGLNQNGFRDYEPETGRYVESDPLGLDGGLNAYLYASGNAVNRTDPLGLTDWAGTSLEYSAGPYSGGTYTLSNVCTGQGEDKLLVRVQADSYGFSSLPKKLRVPISYSGTSNVSFSDSNALPDTKSFNGVYASYGAAFGAVVGGAFGKTRLGNATTDWGWSLFIGYQVSVGGAIGQSRVLWTQKMGKCSCDGIR